MLFNSAIFFLFLPIVLAGYYALSRRHQNTWLLIASYVFYGYWDWRFLGLILLSTLVDYVVARAMHARSDERARRRLLLCSILTNLGLLGFFKYFGFFVESAGALLSSLGLDPHLPVLSVVLPVGISFYTFQTLSYTIDVYRRRITPTDDFWLFALFVSYFPQLVAGPIERASHLLPQLAAKRTVQWPGIGVGLELMLIGFFKKVAVADTIAPIVDVRFGSPQVASGAELLFAAYLFAVQIYCDFSGYSDIARGVSKLMGVDLCRNFEQPYLSRSITEFWRRWHISLSSWLRDYLYIPLGGNRHGSANTYRNLMLTMLLGGLWHGANWTFVVWGGLHGLYLAVHRAWSMLRGRSHEVVATGVAWTPRAIVGMLTTFHLVTFTWVFFRAADFEKAWTYLGRIATWSPAVVTDEDPFTALQPAFGVLIALLIVIDVIQARRGHHAFLVGSNWAARGLAYAVLLVVIFALGNLYQDVPFIYFQF